VKWCILLQFSIIIVSHNDEAVGTSSILLEPSIDKEPKKQNVSSNKGHTEIEKVMQYLQGKTTYNNGPKHNPKDADTNDYTGHG
jgi:hypothetical protein